MRRDAEGRAHLVTLAAPLFAETWQNEVATGAANTAHGFLADGHTRENAAALGRAAMAATSQIADGVLRLAPGRSPACRSGCSHCCHQAVGVSPPEVFAIHDHLRATRTAGELEAIAGRVRAADDRTRGMTPAQRLSPELPCPFLDQDRCAIYDARPLACRGTNALDAAACERSLRDPEARARFLAGQLPVPRFLEPIRAFHAVAAGLQLALDELHGLESAPLELTAAMRVLIDDPEAVAERWLGGHDPFAAARGGDNTGDPHMRALLGLGERPRANRSQR